MRWNIDPTHSTAEFSVRHLMITNVKGRFGALSGVVNYSPEKPEAISIEATIDATSIDTRDEKRDGHLKSADFFDVEKFPTISFKSTSVKAKSKNEFDVTGDLTMHGVTKKVTLPVTFGGQAKDPWGNTRAGFDIETTLDRKDYGIVWNKALDSGGVMLGDDVKVAINLEAVKKVDKPAAKGK